LCLFGSRILCLHLVTNFLREIFTDTPSSQTYKRNTAYVFQPLQEHLTDCTDLNDPCVLIIEGLIGIQKTHNSNDILDHHKSFSHYILNELKYLFATIATNVFFVTNKIDSNYVQKWCNDECQVGIFYLSVLLTDFLNIICKS